MQHNLYNTFWRRYPAFFYGLILFLGSLFALATSFALIPFLLLLHRHFLLRSILLFLFPCALVYQFYHLPPHATEVEGNYYIHSIRKNERYGGGWNYQGILKTDKGRIHCRSFAKEYRPAGLCYDVKGKLRSVPGKKYMLKTHAPWKQGKKRFTLVDLRYRAQESVKDYIMRHVPLERAAHFLGGMVTGQLEDKIMQKEFCRLGLSHLMAISGLHFGLIALACHLLLRLFLPPKAEACALIGFLTLYFLFVGGTPSIIRAWTMAIVFLVGFIVERRSSAINALGVALCVSLLWDPFSALTLSFQLSFLATAGILFFYAPCERLLQKCLPKWQLKEVAARHIVLQYLYFGCCFLREALALNLAVHITLAPLLLSVFHLFPLSSLLYNLFFPFLASLTLLFFLGSLLLGPFSHLAHVANGYYADTILRITESPPIELKTLYVSHVPPWLLTLLLTLIFIAAICLNRKRNPDSFS